MAPKGTPPAIVAKLNAEVGRIVGAPDVAKAWKVQGTVPMLMGVDEFARYVADDITKWAHIVQISGAKADK